MLQINFSRLEREIPGFAFNNKAIGDVINTTVPYLFGIAGLVLLLYLLWGGFQMMTSRGDAKAVEGAKSKITSALAGFVIIFISYWLVQLLGMIFGISQIGDIFR